MPESATSGDRRKGARKVPEKDSEYKPSKHPQIELRSPYPTKSFEPRSEEDSAEASQVIAGETYSDRGLGMSVSGEEGSRASGSRLTSDSEMSVATAS